MADLKLSGVSATNAQRLDLMDNLNGKNTLYLFDDMLGVSFTTGGQVGQTGFSTSSASGGNISQPNSESGAIGIIRLQSTANNNDRATIAYLGNNSMLFAGANYKLTMRCRVPSAQNVGVDEFDTAFGFHDLPTNPRNATDGAYFSYSIESANWICITRNNSVETTTNVGSAVPSNTWQTFEIEFVDGGTPTVYFRIDGTLVATHTTNIPITRHFSLLFTSLKTVGTSSIQMLDIDAMRLMINRSTAIPNF